MSYERMQKREAELKAEVARMVAATEAAAEEERHIEAEKEKQRNDVAPGRAKHPVA